MKTNLVTPSSHYSKSENRYDIAQPKALHELTQPQLRYILECKVGGIGDVPLQTYCFFHFGGLHLVRSKKDGALCWFRHGLKKHKVALTTADVDFFASQLAFIHEPSEPVRLEKIDGCRAADAYLHGVSFEEYLIVEGYWSAFLRTRDVDLLTKIAGVLYHGRRFLCFGRRQPKRLSDAEQLGIIYWMSGWKVFCGEHWQHFFRRVEEDIDEEDADDMESAVSTQIRALTGGDITKVNGVMHADVWDALTELDALAKESQDRKRELNKH